MGHNTVLLIGHNTVLLIVHNTVLLIGRNTVLLIVQVPIYRTITRDIPQDDIGKPNAVMSTNAMN